MKKSKLVYLIINIGFGVAALCFINFKSLIGVQFSFPEIAYIIVLFIVIHLTRFVRMYFILLEDLIRPNRFLQLYVKTTFVSSLIPFKIGELFKMYCYGVETNNTLKGVMAVIIEKFFDALVLCVFMVPEAFLSNTINVLLIILLTFMIIVMVLYFSFENTYQYLNRFLICRGGGVKSVMVLKVLEVINRTYLATKNTLNGRSVLLLFLSVVAWGVEGLLYVVINKSSVGLSFDMITKYVSDVFFGVENTVFNYYALLVGVLFVIMMTIIYGKKYFKVIIRKRRELRCDW